MTDHEDEHFVCDNCQSHEHYNRALYFTKYYFHCGDTFQNTYLCPNCADYWGLIDRNMIFQIIGSTPFDGESIDFENLTDLCANILPFPLESIREYDDEDDEEVMEYSVAKYLQFILQFYGIYLEVSHLDTEGGWEMYLKLHSIPNSIVIDYMQRYHSLIEWRDVECFSYKRVDDLDVEFENYQYYFVYDKTVKFTLSNVLREYFMDLPLYLCECGGDLSQPVDPFFMLNKFKDRDDMLVKF
jgi:hypothetical protein